MQISYQTCDCDELIALGRNDHFKAHTDQNLSDNAMR